MKPLALPLLLTGVIFACSPHNSRSTEPDEQQILSEVRTTVAAFTNAFERADSSAVLKFFADNGKFMCVNNGVAYDYKSFRQGTLEQLASLESQNYTIKSEQFQVTNSNSVLYTFIGSNLDRLRNGVRISVDPLAATLLLEKINNEWKVVYLHESATVKMDSTHFKQ